jgi:hypothetical protein
MPPATTLIVVVAAALTPQHCAEPEMSPAAQPFRSQVAPMTHMPIASMIFAQESLNPLGDDLLVLLTLAMGGALLVGNVLALVRPREETVDGELERPPLARSLAMAAIGLVATIWAVASLVT